MRDSFHRVVKVGGVFGKMERGKNREYEACNGELGFSIYDPGCFEQFLKSVLYVLGSS